MSFDQFAEKLSQHFTAMGSRPLFRTTVQGDDLWNTYLASFPSGLDPIYRTRTEHDCSCCRHFIRTLGGVVSIVDGVTVSLWDFVGPTSYIPVNSVMSDLVHRHPIDTPFTHYEPRVGNRQTHATVPGSTEVLTFNHYYATLPSYAVMAKDIIGPFTSRARSAFDVFSRGLRELTMEAVDAVLDLISNNNLYRGAEHREAVAQFRKLLSEYQSLSSDKQVNFVWTHYRDPHSCIRNAVIGTLLVDLSEGMELEAAVRAFESKVAPTNYMRTTAPVTGAMIQKAKATIQSLGLTSALERRYATIDDILVDDVLYIDRKPRLSQTDVFDELASKSPVKLKENPRTQVVSIDEFIQCVLPSAQSIDVLVENRHTSNFVSLVAPVDPLAKPLFRWHNNFSWSYAGDVADSIKERVKKAGGNVTGDFRASLSWFNYDDLDLHLIEPSGEEIMYNYRRSRHGGMLDVDMNAGYGQTREAVENICYPHKVNMQYGTYTLRVHNFAQRESQDPGFKVELEFDGTTYHFTYDRPVANHAFINVAVFEIGPRGLRILDSLPQSTSNRTVWGITTQTLHRVNAIMLSPNYWGGSAVGNCHYLLMLDGCRNEGTARGFYSEFLNPSLLPHRKVLELVGAKMRTEESDRQLSGLGFSSTMRNDLLVKVGGLSNPVVKITF